ncbi:MAG: hypothetical protein R3C69_06015 [Geminicoccaceae bacterium]
MFGPLIGDRLGEVACRPARPPSFRSWLKGTPAQDLLECSVFFGRFGRAEGLRQLDTALRAVDLHPAVVPEAVKLTTLRQLQQATDGKPQPLDFAAAAELLAYRLITGPEAFTQATDATLKTAVESRIEAAIRAGDSLDAHRPSSLLHAGLTQPEVVARSEPEAG